MDRTPKTAVILAAGRGRRLKPHTDYIPKPLLPYQDAPVLFYVIDSIISAHIKNIVIITNHHAKQIKNVVQNNYGNLNIRFCTQEILNGTASALLATQKLAEKPLSQHGYILITAADYVFPRNYVSNLICNHVGGIQDITLSVRNLVTKPASQSSVVETDKIGNILHIREKPHEFNDFDNIGATLLYIVPTSIMQYLRKIKLSERKEYEIQDTIEKTGSESNCF